MLILTRRASESLYIDGARVVVHVVRIGRSTVKLAIDAPEDVSIQRGEVFCRPPRSKGGTSDE